MCFIIYTTVYNLLLFCFILSKYLTVSAVDNVQITRVIYEINVF